MEHTKRGLIEYLMNNSKMDRAQAIAWCEKNLIRWHEIEGQA